MYTQTLLSCCPLWTALWLKSKKPCGFLGSRKWQPRINKPSPR